MQPRFLSVTVASILDSKKSIKSTWLTWNKKMPTVSINVYRQIVGNLQSFDDKKYCDLEEFEYIFE